MKAHPERDGLVNTLRRLSQTAERAANAFETRKLAACECAELVGGANAALAVVSALIQPYRLFVVAQRRTARNGVADS